MTIAIAFCACSPKAPDEQITQEAWEKLGAQLFFDPRLSTDGQVSCATCHSPQLAFTDARPVSIGVHGRVGTRNSPSLLDITLVTSFFWDGREAELADVVLQPFTNEAEMGHSNLCAAVDAVTGVPEHRTAFAEITGRESLTAEDISRALLSYIQSLSPGSSRFERGIRTNDLSKLSTEELAGLKLFRGKAQCSTCHLIDNSSPTFTDNQFHHTGIGFDRIAGSLAPLLQRVDALETAGLPLGQLALGDQRIAELGRFLVTRKPQDLGAFRTPSLRNVANTPPYMHDGSVPTLEEAIERELYYRSLTLGRPINLTTKEQDQLALFLRALSAE